MNTGLRVFTPWGAICQPEIDGDASKLTELERLHSDPARHCLFQWWALQLLAEHYPHLYSILHENDGKVLVAEGAFYVAASHEPKDWVEIPFLSELLRLVPWREAGEVAH